MCQLCTDNESDLQAARKTFAQFAAQLEELAWIARGLANGTVRPHSQTKPIEQVRPLADGIAHELVRGWGVKKQEL
jgi:hypothetical protein